MTSEWPASWPWYDAIPILTALAVVMAASPLFWHFLKACRKSGTHDAASSRGDRSQQQRRQEEQSRSPLCAAIAAGDSALLAELLKHQEDGEPQEEQQQLNPQEAAAALEAVATSHNLAALQLLASSYGPAFKAAAAGTSSASPPEGLPPATAALISSRKWMEVLVSALLKVPDSIRASLAMARAAAAAPGRPLSLPMPLPPYERLDQAAQQLAAFGRPGVQSLLHFWGLSTLPAEEAVQGTCATVPTGALTDACAAWCAVTLRSLSQLGAALAAPAPRLGAADGEGGWTTLHYIASGAYGTPALLRWLVAQPGVAAAASAPTQRWALSPLHLAAAAGGAAAPELVCVLLAAGADASAGDAFGRTPADIALAAGDAQTASVLQGASPPLTPLAPPGRSASAAAAADGGGGWSEAFASGDWVADTPGVICLDLGSNGIGASSSVYGAGLEGHARLLELIKHGLTLNRPVIVRGLALGAARQRWARDQLLSTHGALRVRASAVPHAEAYGASEAPQTMTLADFVSRWPEADAGRGGGGDGEPLYVFSTSTPDDLSKLWEDMDLPACMTPLVDAALSFTFYCGPRGSGAPFHDHTAAWNACVFGHKRWALLPPGAGALTSRVHSARWLRAGGRGAPQGALEFVQGPGEVVFVPPHWTHAVLNLSEVVGVASEFGAHAYPPVLPPSRAQQPL